MSVCFVIISFVADHEMYQLYYISFSETSTSRLLNIIQSSQITTDKVEFPIFYLPRVAHPAQTETIWTEYALRMHQMEEIGVSIPDFLACSS